MKFQIVNSHGATIMETSFKECVPDKKQRELMYSAGYRFKLDGANCSLKKLNEIFGR